jgi:ribosomal protein L29
MKTKEKQSMASMKVEELKKVLLDAQSALSIFVMGRFGKQSKNQREGRVLKRKIAVILTIIRQKELQHE